MLSNIIIIFYFLILFRIIKCDNEINNKYDTILEKFPEFKNVTSQYLYMIAPSDQCQLHQRTIFFKYPSFMEQNLQNLNITDLKIENKEYFVGVVERFKKDIKSTYAPKNIKETLSKNGIIRLFQEEDVNLYWRQTREKSVIPKNIHKYQRYNHMLMFHEITRKNLLYKNYDIFRKLYPKDFEYMPETYTSKSFEKFKELFKDYKLSKDNLWLVKPRNSSLGKGIRFLENVENIKKGEIVTKYISDPLLINGKKFDLRFHVLVTGHNPLKAYIHSDGFAKISTENYDLDINNLNNTYKHITNIYLNIKNKERYIPENNLWSLEKIKIYLEENYNIKYSDILKDVKDIIVKTLITMNHLEINKEKEYNLSSNNLFDLYGFDIIIDSQFKPWLVEVNISPSLTDGSLTKDRKKMLYQILHDVFNVLGMVPYSHTNGSPLEKGDKFENSTDEAVQQSICEFTRPLGGFEQIFPLKENIDYYKQFFKEISPNNQALWNEIKNTDLDKEYNSIEMPQNSLKSPPNNKILDNTNFIMANNSIEEKSNKNDLLPSNKKRNDKNKNRYKSIKNKRNLNRKRSSRKAKRFNKYSGFKYISSQHLFMLSPSSQCQCHQRTIFFKYPSFIEQNIENLNITELEIRDKEFFVGAIQHYYNRIKTKFIRNPLNETLSNNNIIRLYNIDQSNLYFRYMNKNIVKPKKINKYKKYNFMLTDNELDRKDLLYKNYINMKNEFPDDFTYLPKTYTKETMDEFKKDFKDYKVSKENLWLVKPNDSYGGMKIHLLNNTNDVRKNDIVTKYISDPLLINKKKFDIRFHVLVTGHNPLKIYLHTDGFSKISTEDYDTELNNINNIYKHVTNLHINKRNKKICKLYPENCLLSLEKTIKILENDYHLNFSEIMKEIKDIIIKSFISINHKEIKEGEKYNFTTNNLFNLYGIDIIIDSKFKPWLVEINISPALGDETLTMDRKKFLFQTLNDLFNIIGIMPYSHISNLPLEKEDRFSNSTEEAIQQSLCEFTRPLGGFKRIFPLKENIDFYKKYFKEISPNNQALWEKIQELDEI